MHVSSPAARLTGDLVADAAVIRDAAAACDDRVAALPPKPARTPDEQAAADAAHRPVRSLRAGFLRRHGRAVYDEVTAGRALRPRLAELAVAAAERFPGLAPDRTRLAAEEALPQAHKEGLAIDHGVFFRQMLADPETGGHLLDSMRAPTARAHELLPAFARTGELDLGTVRVAREGATAQVTLANTDCLNAETNELAADLETAVDVVLLDDAVEAGVLRGAEMAHPRYAGRRVFSAGINLKHLHAGRISYLDFLLGRELGLLSKLRRGLWCDDGTPDAWPHLDLAKPWVAAVDTFAIGGGMQILLAVDHVVAGDDVYFSLPAAQEGIVPGMANFRLTALFGGRLTRQVILDGRRIGAGDPEARLVCDEVVAPAAVGDAAAAAAERLASPAVAVNRRMIDLAEEPPDRFRAYAADFAFAQALRLHSADVLTKVSRFSLAGRAG
ncbi:(3,5-dihydroxyphenyl)acetyl-CoA 1,2-dioxygenase DpgC [Streptomyces sp. 8N706]|uniref:(3,5-dihydroxyphenyl)acetyl-CoA 1,2-dioxygenase DpgC n=1 Tax=Streptomyces sp. 8N706 TaxID=3457416 RepID=UPI003FCF691C